MIVNGHYGNVFGLGAITGALTRDLKTPIAATTYFFEGDAQLTSILDDQDRVMHACEAETSMMMAAVPELVDVDRLVDAHGPCFDMAASLRPSLKRFTPFDQLTGSGVAGDARRASSGKGEALLARHASALARRLEAGEPWASSPA